MTYSMIYNVTEILLKVALNTIMLFILISSEDHQFLKMFMTNWYLICEEYSTSYDIVFPTE